MHKIGINAKFEGKNDLRIDGEKISGNAEHVYKDKVLHHGTLLFKSDLKHLRNSLKRKSNEYESKAVQSVRSPVTNIFSHLENKMTTQEFFDYLHGSIAEYFPKITEYKLSEKDKQEIGKLIEEKYSRWEWVFGYSPDYSFNKAGKFQGYKLLVKIEASNAIVRNHATEN